MSRPIILIDGVPEPRLMVREFRTTGPLDFRWATVTIADPDALPDAARLQRWRYARWTIVQPTRLNDQQVRHAVLLDGRSQREESALASGADRVQLILEDTWNLTMARTVASVWSESAEGLLYEGFAPASLNAGPNANRSTSPWLIAGQTSHVLQHNGQAWTVGAALATLAVFGGFEWSLHLLPRDLYDAPLLDTIDLSQPLGDAIARVVQPYDLIVQRDLVREAGVVHERRAVRPVDRGRRVAPAWAREGQSLGEVLKVDTSVPPAAAQRWIAQTVGKIIESTFELKPGWDPALEGAADASYSRSNNPDFTTYANVYRLWVLNEDGFFSTAPYSQGDAFDLGSLFNEPTLRPRPLRFLSCLTLDDAGRRRAPIVQVSLDGGQNWTSYSGPVQLRPDRCAVYLDDTTLDAAFLTAAKAGDAVIRVTASLQSPLPFEVARWRGNPFAGALPPRVLDVSEAFAYQQVAAASIHAADITAGNLTALQRDPSNDMSQWLLARMQWTQRAGAPRTGRAKLTLAGAWPLIRIGDHLADARGRGVAPTGQSEAIVAGGAMVDSVRCRWPDAARPTASSTVDSEIGLRF